MPVRPSWIADLRSGAIRPNVLALGFTSFFTDISSEMVTAALPAYAVMHLGLSPLEFGAIDGIQRGAALLVGVVIAFFADRSRRHKRHAMIGYALSAACKLALFATAGVARALVPTVLIDRMGKGLRSPSRDALIAASAEPRVLATAFGLHRMLDALGAFLGPIAAFVVLVTAPLAFDAIFLVSLCVACVGVACLALFVHDVAPGSRSPATVREALALFREPRFRALTLVALLFALGTASESFLYVVLGRQTELPESWMPLLFSGTAVVQLASTLPLSRMADRAGRARVFLGGHAFLLVAYAALLVPLTGTIKGPLLIASLGAFLAATDGVVMAMTSAVVDADRRASGLAIVTGVVGGGRLIASLAFGALWTNRFGATLPLAVFGGVIACAIPIAYTALAVGKPAIARSHEPT